MSAIMTSLVSLDQKKMGIAAVTTLLYWLLEALSAGVSFLILTHHAIN
jgi:hypothetical protein